LEKGRKFGAGFFGHPIGGGTWAQRGDETEKGVRSPMRTKRGKREGLRTKHIYVVHWASNKPLHQSREKKKKTTGPDKGGGNGGKEDW